MYPPRVPGHPYPEPATFDVGSRADQGHRVGPVIACTSLSGARAPAQCGRLSRPSRRAAELTGRGELSVETAEGPRAETRAILCACGQSGHQPYCDHAGPCGE
ncbi:CDGSH iron-sulfur domain-containing protein [Streptomyces sp. NPDC005262]|uniref:CDGSH iron-sulfur domain-containing protein n=1 Tax=Streptomyces sp. NPDC005262 TaxID=3364710 RepID=UPI0036D10A7C